MIKLNLLPPQEKEILALEKNQRWVVFYSSAIFGILLIFVSLLAIIWIFITIQLKSVTSNLDSIQSSFRGQDLKTQQTAISNLNNYLEKINTIQKNQKSYSNLIIYLAGIVPGGVRLDTLSLNDRNEVGLNGFAQRREQVVALKDALEKSELFSNVESPLSNLVKEAAINFYFKFKLQPNALIK